MSRRSMSTAGNYMTINVKSVRSVFAAFCLLLLFSLYAPAAEEAPKKQSADAGEVAPAVASVPDLAEIVPLEVKLIGRLKDLEKHLQTGVDGQRLEKGYKELEATLDELAQQLDTFKKSQDYKYNKLVDLRELLRQKREAFDLVNKPLSQSIRELGALRKDWQAEENRWREWQATLLKEGEFEQLRSIFAQASESIDSALDLILSKINAMLVMQERAGEIEQKLDTLYGEAGNLIAEERRNTLFNDTPPMLSKKYLAQLGNSKIWEGALNGFKEISRPDSETAAQHGWIVALQAFLSLILIVSIRKKKNLFQETKRWRFLALFPVASGLFFGYAACVLIYEYQGVPGSWKLLVTIIGGTSFARMMKGVVDENWKAWFIYGLVAIIIVTRVLIVLGVPVPVFRLYICFAALVGLIFCQRLVAELKQENKTGIFFWLLRSGGWFFAVVIFMEIWGSKAQASYLFISFILSLGIIIVFVLLMHMMRGCLEWLFNTPFLRGSTALNDKETDIILLRLSRFFNVLVALFVIVPATLMFWGVYESLAAATRGVLSYGFTIGASHITIGLLMISATILYSSFLISWVVQKLLVDEVLFKRRMEKGARISIASLVNYFIVVIGFILAISALGLEITKLTIMVSALGVGIGFGLQGIVNNFVSGLILLFEQPIRIGDLIEINGMWAEVKHIGIRATLVRNFDHADIIIPNADLVSNQVTNWTLGDRQARLIIAVGVAYGSDVDLVIETLIGCALDNTHVNQNPAPQVFFLNFGESTLDFELRVFVPASMRLAIRSELNQEIDKRFREKDITIAFPQRDLHLPGLDIQKSQENITGGRQAAVQPQENTGHTVPPSPDTLA